MLAKVPTGSHGTRGPATALPSTPPQSYSNPVPDGTRVPEWAFIDVTKEGIWDPVLSYQYGNQVEISPGEPATMTSLPAPTSSSTAVPGLSSSQAQFLSSKTKHHSHNGRKIAAIVGGTLCGIALVGASAALFVWRARVKRRQTTRAAAAVIFGSHAMPMQEKVSRPREEPVDAVAEAI